MGGREVKRREGREVGGEGGKEEGGEGGGEGHTPFRSPVRISGPLVSSAMATLLPGT